MNHITNSGVIMNSTHGDVIVTGGNVAGHDINIGNTCYERGRMTEADWRVLEEFLVGKQLELGPRDARYQTCASFAEQVEKKDEKGFLNILKVVGKGFFEALLGVGVSTAVRTSILTIIEKLG